MPQFSVLIPVLNGGNYLAEALQSIADQTLDGVQVVVSDNASTDDTPKILEDWQDRLNLRVVRQPRTLPMQEHFNALLDMVDTDFYMLLCHDDYLAAPDALLLAHEALVAEPDVAAVYCNLLYVNPQRRKLGIRRFNRPRLFPADEAGEKTLRTGRNHFGIPLGIRRQSLGGLRYDPRFHYAMDVDLSWALSRHQDALHIDRPLIANRYGRQNMTWALLSKSLDEYFGIAQKYDFPLSLPRRISMRFVNFIVGQQKRAFGLYQDIITWRG